MSGVYARACQNLVASVSDDLKAAQGWESSTRVPPAEDPSNPLDSAGNRKPKMRQNEPCTFLYASIGPRLLCFLVDIASGTLTEQGETILPNNVQYAWPHANGRYFYVASGENRVGSSNNYVTAFRVDPGSGQLAKLGEDVELPQRPVHITTDADSQHLLVAFNNPSGMRIYRIEDDFRIGSEVVQDIEIDAGIFAHQVRVSPDNRNVILVTRGNKATDLKPEDPGALMVFKYQNGRLSDQNRIAPNNGYGFGVRHLDFHPNGRWIYVALELQNKLQCFTLEDQAVSPRPFAERFTVSDPENAPLRQIPGAIHMHPNGKYVYVSNRADGTMEWQGQSVFAGGENTIAVFALDEHTGTPSLHQLADTRKIHPRTFHIDPSGTLMVVQHNMPRMVRQDGELKQVSAGLTVFRIKDDGTLKHLREYDFDVSDALMWWCGMITL